MNLSFMNYFSGALIKIFFFPTKDPTSKKCAHCNRKSFYRENIYFENFFQYRDLDLSVDARPHGVKTERSHEFAECCGVVMTMLTENLNITFDRHCILRWR